MFAIGAWLLLFLLLVELARPGLARKRWFGSVAGVGVALMVASLLVLAWRWLP